MIWGTNDWKNGIAIIRDGDAISRAGLVAGWLQLWTWWVWSVYFTYKHIELAVRYVSLKYGRGVWTDINFGVVSIQMLRPRNWMRYQKCVSVFVFVCMCVCGGVYEKRFKDTLVCSNIKKLKKNHQKRKLEGATSEVKWNWEECAVLEGMCIYKTRVVNCVKCYRMVKKDEAWEFIIGFSSVEAIW